MHQGRRERVTCLLLSAGRDPLRCKFRFAKTGLFQNPHFSVFSFCEKCVILVKVTKKNDPYSDVRLWLFRGAFYNPERLMRLPGKSASERLEPPPEQHELPCREHDLNMIEEDEYRDFCRFERVMARIARYNSRVRTHVCAV